MKVEFVEDDGRKWYELTGTHDGTGIDFKGEIFGICDDGTLVDCDGCGLTEGDYQTIAVGELIG